MTKQKIDPDNERWLRLGGEEDEDEDESNDVPTPGTGKQFGEPTWPDELPEHPN
ncbi:hypothetical protein FHW69_002619 [Luteibacter sp. Sphag1AF]|uniref:hypothetical protein n=1 Tax=Luteibacter sp. Sphag1AF TaxID=2587031 RepID=UPI0016096195|nr:hypothetical protein [Luteibacter sp. Sphag1AF]MBB3227987.1 hypothetical protein [Luteibacter sp. Sphag1AF]